MKLSISGDIEAVMRDLDHVGRDMVPEQVAKALNRVADRHVHGPATKATADAVRLPVGVVRWHHTNEGKRTDRRRIRRRAATVRSLEVTWRWSTRTGQPGAVALISVPRRRQTRSGFKAASYDIPGGFINRTRSGKRLLSFKRVGRERLPIEILKVDMTQEADREFAARIATASEPFRMEFTRLMRMALGRRTRARVRRVRRVARLARRALR